MKILKFIQLNLLEMNIMPNEDDRLLLRRGLASFLVKLEHFEVFQYFDQ